MKKIKLSKCEYCNKEGLTQNVTIRYRDREWQPHFGRMKHKQVVKTKTCKVCKDGPCGGNLQMAHEG